MIDFSSMSHEDISALLFSAEGMKKIIKHLGIPMISKGTSGEVLRLKNNSSIAGFDSGSLTDFGANESGFKHFPNIINALTYVSKAWPENASDDISTTDKLKKALNMNDELFAKILVMTKEASPTQTAEMLLNEQYKLIVSQFIFNTVSSPNDFTSSSQYMVSRGISLDTQSKNSIFEIKNSTKLMSSLMDYASNKNNFIDTFSTATTLVKKTLLNNKKIDSATRKEIETILDATLIQAKANPKLFFSDILDSMGINASMFSKFNTVLPTFEYTQEKGKAVREVKWLSLRTQKTRKDDERYKIIGKNGNIFDERSSISPDSIKTLFVIEGKSDFYTFDEIFSILKSQGIDTSACAVVSFTSATNAIDWKTQGVFKAVANNNGKIVLLTDNDSAGIALSNNIISYNLVQDKKPTIINLGKLLAEKGNSFNDVNEIFNSQLKTNFVTGISKFATDPKFRIEAAVKPVLDYTLLNKTDIPENSLILDSSSKSTFEHALSFVPNVFLKVGDSNRFVNIGNEKLLKSVLFLGKNNIADLFYNDKLEDEIAESAIIKSTIHYSMEALKTRIQNYLEKRINASTQFTPEFTTTLRQRISHEVGILEAVYNKIEGETFIDNAFGTEKNRGQLFLEYFATLFDLSDRFQAEGHLFGIRGSARNFSIFSVAGLTSLTDKEIMTEVHDKIMIPERFLNVAVFSFPDIDFEFSTSNISEVKKLMNSLQFFPCLVKKSTKVMGVTTVSFSPHSVKFFGNIPGTSENTTYIPSDQQTLEQSNALNYDIITNSGLEPIQKTYSELGITFQQSKEFLEQKNTLSKEISFYNFEKFDDLPQITAAAKKVLRNFRNYDLPEAKVVTVFDNAKKDNSLFRFLILNDGSVIDSNRQKHANLDIAFTANFLSPDSITKQRITPFNIFDSRLQSSFDITSDEVEKTCLDKAQTEKLNWLKNHNVTFDDYLFATSMNRPLFKVPSFEVPIAPNGYSKKIDSLKFVYYKGNLVSQDGNVFYNIVDQKTSNFEFKATKPTRYFNLDTTTNSLVSLDGTTLPIVKGTISSQGASNLTVMIGGKENEVQIRANSTYGIEFYDHLSESNNHTMSNAQELPAADWKFSTKQGKFVPLKKENDKKEMAATILKNKEELITLMKQNLESNKTFEVFNFLNQTHGILVWQEQLMLFIKTIVSELGMSEEESGAWDLKINKMRQFVSKSANRLTSTDTEFAHSLFGEVKQLINKLKPINTTAWTEAASVYSSHFYLMMNAPYMLNKGHATYLAEVAWIYTQYKLNNSDIAATLGLDFIKDMSIFRESSAINGSVFHANPNIIGFIASNEELVPNSHIQNKVTIITTDAIARHTVHTILEIGQIFDFLQTLPIKGENAVEKDIFSFLKNKFDAEVKNITPENVAKFNTKYLIKLLENRKITEPLLSKIVSFFTTNKEAGDANESIPPKKPSNPPRP